MPHQDFLDELVLADEVTRRDRSSAAVRARAAHLDPSMMLEAWDDTAKVTFDRQLWAELTTLRFLDDAHNVIVLGPVGVGKTFMATALGHIACRRRRTVEIAERGDRLLKRLKAARLDNSHEAEVRRLIRVELLVSMTSRSRRSTPWRPPTSTRSAWNLTGAPRPGDLQPRREEWLAIWPIPCSPSPPSTASRPPPTSWWSRANPTAAARNHPSTTATTRRVR